MTYKTRGWMYLSISKRGLTELKQFTQHAFGKNTTHTDEPFVVVL